MKQGYLSQYFDGVAVKRLSAVETDLGRSHQHEFNGSVDMRRLFGEPLGKVSFPAKFVYFLMNWKAWLSRLRDLLLGMMHVRRLGLSAGLCAENTVFISPQLSRSKIVPLREIYC